VDLFPAERAYTILVALGGNKARGEGVFHGGPSGPGDYPIVIPTEANLVFYR
jgi:hypothetical protein